MRVVVVGAGAIGGVIGGRLYEYRHDVVLVARGAHYEALAQTGLRLQSPEREVTLQVPVKPHVSELEIDRDDVVLLATKSQDTAAVISDLEATAPPSIGIVCAQNGVENERIALRAFGRVYGMCVMCPTTHLVPGVVAAHSAPVTGLLDLGCWPSGVDSVSQEIAAMLRASTFSSEARPDITRWKWGKLLLNLTNAVEAICGPGARSGELARRARREGIECLEAAAVEHVDQREDRARRGDVLKVLPAGPTTRGGGSSWQSLARASGSIETDYLFGEFVLLGRLHGVPTPVNAALQHLASEGARAGRQPGWLSESEVLAAADGRSARLEP